jgi:histone deacetylase complex regulatory component SIN3
LNKIKNLFSNNPETAIKIVVALTRGLTEEKSIKEVITFISGLISAEPNIKKKIVYIKMLKGVL